ncbi:hypothetical protein [Paractinoplanes atraurantiacus]|uniref:Lipoprotein n=1 Tax=Paractinoplanes atraurantiacus TaxID=1036182 RepID=A0A285KJR0_9ACTN|nr:hypothetical protein [Actinoplanes atraurantiacus]SNY72869.1 hypothetical protein SAMN05421748_14437 [Actinoplanes atraurantiacus]
MKSRTVALAGVLLALAAAAIGCEPASYATRMKFLDEMAAKGIEYRTQLHAQRTSPDEAACTIGWRLLDADAPSDEEGDFRSEQWRAEVKEAYVKSCMTGEPLPKPDPSGVKARTPVPITSAVPRPRP